LIASNSSWVIVPESSSSLALAISPADPPRRLAHVLVELILLSLGLLRAALAHAVVLGDQIDQHAEPRQDDDEDHPERLGEAADVVAAEHVDQDGDHDPDPDHPDEEDDHRPKNVRERIVSRYRHSRAPSSLASTAKCSRIHRRPRHAPSVRTPLSTAWRNFRSALNRARSYRQ
jgi:hypothetical protein